jgi:hypothetical protein
MNVADGWSTGIYLEDLRGRGKLDLIMGVGPQVRHHRGHPGLPLRQGRPRAAHLPDAGRRPLLQGSGPGDQVPIPFSFHVTRDSASLDLVFRPNFKGDFNKDGLRDMLVRVDDKTLKIYPA